MESLTNNRAINGATTNNTVTCPKCNKRVTKASFFLRKAINDCKEDECGLNEK